MEPLPLPFDFPLRRKVDVWADNIFELLDRAGKEAWSQEAVTRTKPIALQSEMEVALCQLLTFFLEHKYLSLYSTSKFIPTISPYFGEIAMLLTHHAQDEAKHISVLSKRIEIGAGYQKISAATQYALKSILDMMDFSKSVFLHELLGQSTIVDIMRALGPVVNDDFTKQMFSKICSDEERHIAYG
ncbi:MAG: ferritin-like domain-containing protein, partial [Candidatus Bathyarchaeia archaeon]